MKKCLLILFFPTLLLADIDRVNEEVDLPYWPSHILSGDPNQLNEYFRILLKSLQDITDEIITVVNLGVDLDDTDVRYFGTKDSSGDYADGDWRIIKVSSDDFELQKLISSIWTQQMKWSVASGTESTGTVTAPEFVDSSTSGTSTEWEDAYNKRVDTWTAALSWASNVVKIAATSAYIIVGNSGGTGVAVAMSGDVAIDNTGATTIQADAIEESMLKAVDAPADEEILTYESTTGDFEWETIALAVDMDTQGEYFELDGNGDAMPKLTPYATLSIHWQLDGNDDLQPRVLYFFDDSNGDVGVN